MRTTLDIADDVLFAVKEIAKKEKKPIGQVVSDLARKAFAMGDLPNASTLAPTTASATAVPHVSERLAQYGIKPLPARGAVISNELIDRLRDEEGI